MKGYLLSVELPTYVGALTETHAGSGQTECEDPDNNHVKEVSGVSDLNEKNTELKNKFKTNPRWNNSS